MEGEERQDKVKGWQSKAHEGSDSEASDGRRGASQLQALSHRPQAPRPPI